MDALETVAQDLGSRIRACFDASMAALDARRRQLAAKYGTAVPEATWAQIENALAQIRINRDQLVVSMRKELGLPPAPEPDLSSL